MQSELADFLRQPVEPPRIVFARALLVLEILDRGNPGGDGRPGDIEGTADAIDRIDDMRQFYASLRPYMSGGAYVNYCDLDLPDYATAYWGENLPRLKQIKAAFDPGNVFRHAQSIPLS